MSGLRDFQSVLDEATSSETLLPVELTLCDHYGRETRFILRTLPAVVGRDKGADVRLTDPWASHRHCVIDQIRDVLVVRDLGSKNGVFLDKHRVSESHILSGDRLVIGRTEVTVRYGGLGQMLTRTEVGMPQSNSPCRILIVEDNVAAAKMLAIVLKGIGNHEVQLAYDGEAGLKLAKTFRPQLVLLDIGLLGIDGYEVAKRLRKEPAGDRLLVVAVTGYGQEEERRRSHAAGFDEHLVKPFALEAVQRILHHPKLVERQVA